MSPARRPATLVIAAVLAALEAVALLVLAVLQVVSHDDGESGVGIGLAVFFLLCAVGLGWCAWSLVGLSSWARAPIVLVQLIMLGLAWNGRHNVALAVVLAVVAVGTLAAVFHPASIDALEADDEEQ
ncbi:hypothetical protein [Nocardioides sp. KR10-350]|uniref:hypothetical protein n=1 Tax=Nocardioides cheoyonin TaxID=3156615 RepID=UPI0032B514F4